MQNYDWAKLAQNYPEINQALDKFPGSSLLGHIKPIYHGNPGVGHWIILPQTLVAENPEAAILVYLFPKTKTALICDFVPLRFNLLVMNTPIKDVYNQPSYVLTLPVLWSWEVPTDIVALKSSAEPI